MKPMQRDVIFKKLRLDKAEKPLIVNAPPVFSVLLTGVDHDVVPVRKTAHYDFVLIFATSQAELEKLAKEVSKAGAHDCVFWAAYPKLSGTIKSDIKRETVWIAFEAIGQQAVSSISLDDTWTALRARPIDKVGT